mmetsp:Transcript_32666/g.74065  ORF Transcript_32666/g.74065 Transcript_32666/m.74065 type:complete len:266 (+) Transcript_32666:525-1322(+)
MQLHLLLHVWVLHHDAELFLVQPVVTVAVALYELGAEEGREIVLLNFLHHSVLLLFVRRDCQHRLGGHSCQQAEHGPRHERDEAHEEYTPERWVEAHHRPRYHGPVVRRDQAEEREERGRDVREQVPDRLVELRVVGVHHEPVAYEPGQHDGQHEAEEENHCENPYEGIHHLQKQIDAVMQRIPQTHHTADPQQSRQHQHADQAQAAARRRLDEQLPVDVRHWRRGREKLLHHQVNVEAVFRLGGGGHERLAGGCSVASHRLLHC